MWPYIWTNTNVLPPTNRVNSASSKAFDLINLPIDVFHIVKHFLTTREYRRLLNANKSQYEKIKRYTVFYPLSVYFTKKYQNDETFRAKVNARLFSPSEQIGLYFAGGFYSEITGSLNDIYQVNLAKVTIAVDDVLIFRNIHSLQLDGEGNSSTFTELPYMENVHTLSLNGFVGLVDVSGLRDVVNVKLKGCRYLVDITPLKDCPHLHFEEFEQLQDISCLGSQKCLKLILCHAISEVNHLSSVKELVIQQCHLVRNINELGGVHDLTLHITAIHQLPPRLNNSRLKINSHSVIQYESTFFDNIIDFTFIHYRDGRFPRSFSECPFQKLKLDQCNRIRTLTDQVNLQQLHKLEISECMTFNDVSILGNIPILIISQCNALQSLEGLGKSGQKHVIISSCSLIQSFSPLINVPKVEIAACPGFISLQDLRNCQEIIIKLCGNLISIGIMSSALPSTCKYLQIALCRGFTSTYGLEEVADLEFLDCANLSQIGTLGSNPSQKVYFSNCPQIASIRHLNGLKQVKIQNCIRCDLSTLSQRENLIIVPTNGTGTDALLRKPPRKSFWQHFMYV